MVDGNASGEAHTYHVSERASPHHWPREPWPRVAYLWTRSELQRWKLDSIMYVLLCHDGKHYPNLVETVAMKIPNHWISTQRSKSDPNLRRSRWSRNVLPAEQVSNQDNISCLCHFVETQNVIVTFCGNTKCHYDILCFHKMAMINPLPFCVSTKRPCAILRFHKKAICHFVFPQFVQNPDQ